MIETLKGKMNSSDYPDGPIYGDLLELFRKLNEIIPEFNRLKAEHKELKNRYNAVIADRFHDELGKTYVNSI